MNFEQINSIVSTLGYNAILHVMTDFGDGIFLSSVNDVVTFESCVYTIGAEDQAKTEGNLLITKDEFLIIASQFYDEIL